jgi:hypothetical protein
MGKGPSGGLLGKFADYSNSTKEIIIGVVTLLPREEGD